MSLRETCQKRDVQKPDIRSYLEGSVTWVESNRSGDVLWRHREGSEKVKLDYLEPSFIVKHIAEKEDRDPEDVLDDIVG